MWNAWIDLGFLYKELKNNAEEEQYYKKAMELEQRRSRITLFLYRPGNLLSCNGSCES